MYRKLKQHEETLTRSLHQLDHANVDLQREIAEHTRAEEALRLSEEKFSSAFANNPAAIAITLLEDGAVLDVNDTWLALTGYGREEVLGRSAMIHVAEHRSRSPVREGNSRKRAMPAGGSSSSSRNRESFTRSSCGRKS